MRSWVAHLFSDIKVSYIPTIMIIYLILNHFFSVQGNDSYCHSYMLCKSIFSFAAIFLLARKLTAAYLYHDLLLNTIDEIIEYFDNPYCSFMLQENGYQLLFLSARAISQAYHTRQFLFNLKQVLKWRVGVSLD